MKIKQCLFCAHSITTLFQQTWNCVFSDKTFKNDYPKIIVLCKMKSIQNTIHTCVLRSKIFVIIHCEWLQYTIVKYALTQCSFNYMHHTFMKEQSGITKPSPLSSQHSYRKATPKYTGITS